jgi:hypothetical protein
MRRTTVLDGKDLRRAWFRHAGMATMCSTASRPWDRHDASVPARIMSGKE